MALGEQARVVAGRYRIVRRLGRGAMSEVWLAHDERLERDVALKFLEPGPGLAAEFEREAGILAGLRHPNIVTVYDAGEEDGRRYIVMECVDGVSLRDYLRDNGALDVSRAAEIGGSVASALQYAHARGVLHNDVKPENILLDRDGEARLTDFGAATVTGATLDTEGARQLMGTIAYVAPEVLQGASPSPASDLFALATTLFEAVSGRLPHDAPSNSGLAGQKLNALPAELRDVAPHAPADWAAAIDSALSRTPPERPALADFERRITAASRTESRSPVGLTPVAAGRRPTQPLASPDVRNGHRGLVMLGGLLGAGMVAAGAIAVTSRDDNPPDGEEQPETQLNVIVDQPTAVPTATPPPPSPTPQPDRSDSGSGSNDDDEDDRDDKDDKNEQRKPDKPDKPGRGNGR
jgi:serine/threonine protein kinase